MIIDTLYIKTHETQPLFALKSISKDYKRDQNDKKVYVHFYIIDVIKLDFRLNYLLDMRTWGVKSK